MRRAAAGERCPSGAQRFWWNLWLLCDAARDRCGVPGRASGAAADTLAEPRTESGPPRPVSHRSPGIRSPLSNAGRVSTGRGPNCSNQTCRACNQIAAPNEPAALSGDAAGGSTSPLPQTFDSCAAARPPSCPPCKAAAPVHRRDGSDVPNNVLRHGRRRRRRRASAAGLAADVSAADDDAR